MLYDNNVNTVQRHDLETQQPAQVDTGFPKQTGQAVSMFSQPQSQPMRQQASMPTAPQAIAGGMERLGNILQAPRRAVQGAAVGASRFGLNALSKPIQAWQGVRDRQQQNLAGLQRGITPQQMATGRQVGATQDGGMAPTYARQPYQTRPQGFGMGIGQQQIGIRGNAPTTLSIGKPLDQQPPLASQAPALQVPQQQTVPFATQGPQPAPFDPQQPQFSPAQGPRQQQAPVRLQAGQRKDMSPVQQVGQYEVQNQTNSPEALERFNRQPTAPPQGRVSKGHPMYQGPQGPQSFSPDYGRNKQTDWTRKQTMPNFTADGFSGSAKKARINTMEQRWLKDQRANEQKDKSLASNERVAAMGQAGHDRRVAARIKSDEGLAGERTAAEQEMAQAKGEGAFDKATDLSADQAQSLYTTAKKEFDTWKTGKEGKKFEGNFNKYLAKHDKPRYNALLKSGVIKDETAVGGFFDKK